MPHVMDRIQERVRGLSRRIALPEADDERTLRAARVSLSSELAQPVLVGSPDKVRELADDQSISLVNMEIVDPANEEVRQRCAELYYQRRRHKGVTEDQAYEQVLDPLYCGAAMLSLGDVDGLVTGAAHATSDVLRALLRCVGCAPGVSTVSSCFIIDTDLRDVGTDGTMIYADAGVVPQPTPYQLADITITAAESARVLLEAEPRVALLSFSTHGSAAHPDVKKVVKATRLAQERRPDLIIDGEMQLDAAIVPSVAQRKCPDSPVAGRANVLIFPDLDAGNISYKITQWIAGARAYGPLVQGLAKPGMDLSRAATPDDIVNVIAVAALRAEVSSQQSENEAPEPPEQS